MADIQCKNISYHNIFRKEHFWEAGDFVQLPRSYIRDRKPTGFQNLPVHILINIFKFLDETDIRKNAIPVCHKWRQVALLPELWHKITFKGRHIPSSFIYLQLRMFENLREISLIGICDVPDILRRITKYNKQITKIVVKKCVSEKVPERVLRNLIAACQNLDEISLNGTPVFGNLFYIELAVMPFLKKINISNNRSLTTKNIFEIVLNNSKLEELKISNRNMNQQLSDSDAVFLFSNLKTTLKSVAFDMTGLSDIAYTSLFECDKLERMYLYNSTNLQPNTLIDVWRKLPNLKFLKLHNCQLTSKDFRQLFRDGRGMLQRMELLNLTGCWKLNAEGLRAISSNCRHLKKAIFKCCKHLEDISDLIKHCKRIEILNLAFCYKVQDEMILHIAYKATKLKTLYLDNTRLVLIEELRIHKPKLEIYICVSEYNKKLIRAQ